MKNIRKLKYLGIVFCLVIILITVMVITMSNRSLNDVLGDKTESLKAIESSYLEVEASWNISTHSSNVTATLYTDGLLKITGNGNMKGWESSSEVEWHNKKQYITKIVIGKGVTSIGDWAFSGLEDSISIVIPESIQHIEDNVFAESFNVKIYCVYNSEAHNYAQRNNIQYEADGDGPIVENIEYNTDEGKIIAPGPDYRMNWVNKDVTVVINARDEKTEIDIAGYSFDGGRTWQESNKNTYTEYVSEVKVNVKDILGNITEVSINIMIDKTQPIIQNVVINPTGWTGSQTTLTVNAFDEMSGLNINKQAYSFDGGITWQASNTKTYTENTNGIEIRVTDNVGNVATYQTINITNIDHVAPVINGIQKSTTDWTKDRVTLTVSASDSSSGIGGQAYSFDGGTTWQENNTKIFTENTNGIVVKVKDNVGNITTSDAVNITNIDKVAPTINSITGNSMYWTKDNVTLKVNAQDGMSGITGQAYSFDGGATWQASNTKTYTENTNGIVVKVKDNVGNIATSEVINITKIMKLESISIKTMPNKTVYNINDTLNTEGLVLNLIYNSGTTEEITNGFTCTPTTLSRLGTQEIVVIYMEKTAKFNVEVRGREINSDEYEVNGSYISGIQPNTTIGGFRDNTNSNIKIFDKDGNELKDTDTLCTGFKVFIDNKESYTIVIKGDVNGDGKSDIKDILAINKHRLNKTKLENEYLLASDVNKDGKADIKDILQINKYRLGKINAL